MNMKKYRAIHKRIFFLFFLVLSFLLITESNLNAQTTRKVLFLGNSYTGVNNLPQIIYDVALSVGDTLMFDSYTPGGYRLTDHVADGISQSKIMAGGWDYVVLQGQSQEPVTQSSTFNNGGSQLDYLATQYNLCSVTMLYMTWGRKNGDMSNCAPFPIMCTYEGMDSTIRKSYLDLAADINGEISPVSVVWKYLRQNFPSIDLYQSDESHPSAAGSYAAACCFYASIFKKDPTLISFDFGLSATDAANIRNAAKTQVFDTLSLWDYKQLPESNFLYTIGLGVNEVLFRPTLPGTAETYLWDFGDGDTSSSPFVTHSYLSNGTYIVTLTTTSCDLQGLHTSTFDTAVTFCNHTPTIYTTNPVLCQNDTLWTQPGDTYQWFYDGLAIPQTNQYLPNYYQYNYGLMSVLTTTNGCSELSTGYSYFPLWSGYYFDIWPVGDPCLGDTIPFAVLHINGFLSGFETIQWYKNDTLLPFMTNEDTLLITAGGKYECKVIDPNAICPLDTTSYSFQFNCGTVGVDDDIQDLFWSLFPNPASEITTIKFTNIIINEELQIYNILGRLTKVIQASETTAINISDLPSGLYFIRLINNKQPPLKFIKL